MSSGYEYSGYKLSAELNSNDFRGRSVSLDETNTSSERDHLMEQYELKMGELLNCQKEICDLKNQLVTVVQKSKQNDANYQAMIHQYELQITELQEKFNTLQSSINQSTIQNENAEVSKWMEKCKELEKTIEEKDKIIQGQVEEIDDYNQSASSMNSERMEYLEKFEKQQKEISELKVQLKEIPKLHEHIEDLENTNKELAKGNNEMQEKIYSLQSLLDNHNTESTTIKETLEEQAERVKTLIDKLEQAKNETKVAVKENIMFKNENSLLKSQTAKQTEKIKVLTEDNRKLSEIGTKLQQKYVDVENIVNQIFAASPNISTVSELCEFLNAFPGQQKEVRREMRELRRTNRKLAERAEVADKLEIENNELKITIARLEKIKRISATFARVNRETSQRINSLVCKESPTLRNIIVTSVLIKRWQKSYRSPEYRSDTLNWWWLSPVGNNESLDRISDEFEKNREKDEIIQTLERENSEMKAELDNKLESNKQTENKEVLARKFLVAEIERLNAEISQMVAREKYEEKAMQARGFKKELKSINQNINELKRENLSKDETIGQLKIDMMKRDEESQNLREQLEIANDKITELSDQLKLASKFNSAKRKEFLSLERSVIRAEEDKLKKNIEFRAIIAENDNLLHKKGGLTKDSSVVIRTLL